MQLVTPLRALQDYLCREGSHAVFGCRKVFLLVVDVIGANCVDEAQDNILW